MKFFFFLEVPRIYILHNIYYESLDIEIYDPNNDKYNKNLAFIAR